jgi:hypothetical protein
MGVSSIICTSQKGLHILIGSKNFDALHDAHKTVVAIVGQYVRVPEMGWGDVVDVCRIWRDERRCQRFRVFVKAVKAEPCPQRADPVKLRQALVE